MSRAVRRLRVLLKDSERLHAELRAAHPFKHINEEALRCEGRIAAIRECIDILEDEQ